MCASLDEVIDRAQDTILTSVSNQVLFEINRKDINAKPNYPFPGRIEEDTKKRYKQAWQRIIGYIFRIYTKWLQEKERERSEVASSTVEEDIGYDEDEEEE
ncbi:uncharacterized protein K452DRAFT_303797 [Aplosporella prunicola CBS 121167]|uniref:Uncharacterized protein n=1 Tax=Aplosporella prunicola CBS 121167 TaxID=1176127 RepID=A0A6A6AVW0_9PEZI|nr:uncharacterized protein K452DRAFT_303797 [Aplosporella prunicola CBS 121167]KAF2135105.1 hypothetical protein K452DRAFT_303797 [Aplosporella prunicola CBS 121167]